MSVDVYPTPADVTLGTMSTQNANAVAITDGRISLGGHAPTGVLDVQSSVMASDLANYYVGARIWPVAPAGATNILGISLQFPVGAGLAGANVTGIGIPDLGASSLAFGLTCGVNAGTNRFNIYANGTAPNYFAGQVGVRTPPLTSPTTAAITYAFDGGTWGIIGHANAAGNQSQVVFQNSAAATVGSINTTDSATAYNTSSDTRLKHSIEKLVGALGVVQLLNPVSFLWKADNSPGVGFRADELQQLIPEAVTGEPDALNDDGSIRPQQVDLSKLVPWLTAALQETMAQVEVLAARVIALEARLA